MFQLRIWTLGAFVAITMTNAAQAAYYIEGTGGTGDAGRLLGTSQNTTGAGPFDGIIGRLSVGPAHVDLYRICANGGAFSASTVNAATAFDTQLFLFDSSGMGVIGNDDVSNLNVRSRFTTTLTAGYYYIGISSFDNDPISSGGLIFTNNFPGVQTPTGPGAAFALSEWTAGAAGEGEGGNYRIDIDGASFGDSVHPTPAPAGVVLFGLGFAGLGMFRSFRKGSKVAA